MALNITINKVSVAASFAAGTIVATAIASWGATPYVYSLATGGDKFAINSSTGVVTTIAAMDISNIASFSVTVTDSTTGTAFNSTSDVVYPNIQASIQSKFSKPNMIYKITKDINLGNGVLTIPDGCTLDFQGGSFSNGTLSGDFRMLNPNFRENINIETKYNFSTILSKYGCYTETINGSYDDAKDIHDLGFSYVVYYGYDVQTEEQINAILADMRALNLYGIGVLLYLGTTDSNDVTAIATNFINEPNLIGWYVYDEPVLRNITVKQQEAKMNALKAAKPLPCFVAEFLDEYASVGTLSQKFDYVFISQYYNGSNISTISDDEHALAAYARVSSYSGYGMDKLIPSFETYDTTHTIPEAKLLNNLLVKKSLFKNNGCFFIYSANETQPTWLGIKKSNTFRRVAKAVINSSISQGNMVIKGFCYDELNALKKASQVITNGSGIRVQYGPSQLPDVNGLFLYSSKEYLLIDFGRKVSSCRLTYYFRNGNSLGTTRYFDLAVPLTNNTCMRIGTLAITSDADKNYSNGMKYVYGINSDKLLICTDNINTGNQVFQGIVATGISYSNIENQNPSNIQSYGLSIIGTTAERPTLNSYNEGFEYYDSTLKKKILWNGSKWIDSNGNDANVKYNGTTAQRPTNINIGFQYFDTDLNKPIYWTGSTWIDATRATV